MYKHIRLVVTLLAGILGADKVLAQFPGSSQLGPQPQTSAPPGYQPVYRLAGVALPDHLYSTDAGEPARVAATGNYRYEGVGFYVLAQHYKGSVPLYRLLNSAGRHMLVTDPAAGAARGDRVEGVIGYVDPGPRQGTVALRAWFNPTNGDYLYTTDPNGEWAPRLGMQYRGIVGYVAPVA
jgi:hypothetical protein